MVASLHGQTILIVEDEPFIALDMEATLSAAGAEVISALHLAEAFEAAQNANISAAVLDVNLGEGDCAPLCEVLAQRHVPFIFHTGYMDGGPIAKWRRPVVAKPATQAMDGGPIAKWRRPVVAKPATQAELLDCLARALFGPCISDAVS